MNDMTAAATVTMLCHPGTEMFVLIDADELEARKDRRVPRPE